jgi:hypothetical protein
MFHVKQSRLTIRTVPVASLLLTERVDGCLECPIQPGMWDINRFRVTDEVSGCSATVRHGDVKRARWRPLDG